MPSFLPYRARGFSFIASSTNICSVVRINAITRAHIRESTSESEVFSEMLETCVAFLLAWHAAQTQPRKSGQIDNRRSNRTTRSNGIPITWRKRTRSYDRRIPGTWFSPWPWTGHCPLATSTFLEMIDFWWSRGSILSLTRALRSRLTR